MTGLAVLTVLEVLDPKDPAVLKTLRIGDSNSLFVEISWESSPGKGVSETLS